MNLAARPCAVGLGATREEGSLDEIVAALDEALTKVGALARLF